MLKFIAIVAIATFTNSALAADQLFTSNFVLLSRIGERAVGALSAIVLIFVGYRLLRRESNEKAKTGAKVKISSLGELNLSGYGPGLICIALGAGLVLFSLSNTVAISPTGDVRLFDNNHTTELNRIERNFLATAPGIQKICSEARNDPASKAACDNIFVLRSTLLDSKYKKEHDEFLAVQKKYLDSPTSLSSRESAIYVNGLLMFR